MGILKSKSNKKFSYSPRYYDDKGKGNPFEIHPKFDDFRKATVDNKGLANKFKTAWADLEEKSDRKTNTRLYIIIAILLLIFLFIIDFDLSIFYSN